MEIVDYPDFIYHVEDILKRMYARELPANISVVVRKDLYDMWIHGMIHGTWFLIKRGYINHK